MAGVALASDDQYNPCDCGLGLLMFSRQTALHHRGQRGTPDQVVGYCTEYCTVLEGHSPSSAYHHGDDFSTRDVQCILYRWQSQQILLYLGKGGLLY